MRYVYLLFIVVYSSSFLTAQDAYIDALLDDLATTYNITGGELVLSDSEEQNLNDAAIYGSVTPTKTNTSDFQFTRYHSINVNAEGTNPWDAGLNQRNKKTVRRGDNVLVAFWIRGSSEVTDPKVSFFVENASTFDKEMLLTLDLNEEWTQYLIPYSSIGTYNAGQLAIGLHLAFGIQTVEYAGITLINYEDKYTLQDLPVKQGSGPYAGFEDDAPWRAEAEARIDMYRKADMKIKFTDMGGTPLKNIDVKVKMKKHEFEFGTAVNASLFANNRNQNSTYQNKLLDIDGRGNGFNTIVFENALKWRAWEGEWPTNKAEKINSIKWLAENDITMRGHVLLWPGWQVMPDHMEANKSNPSFLVDEIKDRINTMLTNPDIAEHIRDWDVINEIAANRDIEDALKGTSGYETGREIYAEVFKQVKELDPNLTTYLNDYITIGSNRNDGILYDEFKSFIKEIQDAGGDIDGIGFQGHIGGSPTAPEKIYGILEDFYQDFGLEAKITEYDTDPLVNGELSKKYMEDFLTIILSHQSMKGFLMWGFWDGAHWKQNAPMFNMDWTLKPAGEGFINKVYDEWWVDETMRTDEEGYLDLRVFKGEYEFTPEITNETFDFKLTGDTTATFAGNLIISTSEVEFDSEFYLFPNPTDGLINITNKTNQAFKSEVLDQLGRVILFDNSTDKQQLDISKLNQGIYFVRIRMDGKSYVKKIFKN